LGSELPQTNVIGISSGGARVPVVETPEVRERFGKGWEDRDSSRWLQLT
jgi:hypothetical protein